MRSVASIATTVVSISLAAMALWGMSSAYQGTGTPSVSPSNGSSVGFTVGATPTPSPTGGGGSGGGGGGGGGGTPPVCVPTTKTPTLTQDPAASPGALKVTPNRVAAGSDVLVTAEGFKAGEKVVIVLYAVPVKLGISTVRTNGQVYAYVTIPKRTALGGHIIQVTGFADCKVAAAPVSIVSRRGTGTSIFPWIVWLIAGGALGVAGIGLLIAYLLGWLPQAGAAATAVAQGRP